MRRRQPHTPRLAVERATRRLRAQQPSPAQKRTRSEGVQGRGARAPRARLTWKADAKGSSTTRTICSRPSLSHMTCILRARKRVLAPRLLNAFAAFERASG
jgi:hypothetical protein